MNGRPFPLYLEQKLHGSIGAPSALWVLIADFCYEVKLGWGGGGVDKVIE